MAGRMLRRLNAVQWAFGGLEEWRGILAFFGVKLSGTRYKARLAFAMLCATLRNGFVYRVNGDSSMDDVETELHSAS